MEMNTRLQVEHPVTEEITGIDLVEWQLRIAAGAPLPLHQDEIACHGHAFEARLYAESPETGFLPSTGIIDFFETPAGMEDVRLDLGVEEGGEVTSHYDPMIGKLITYGQDRGDALARMTTLLSRTHLAGPQTNTRFLHAITRHKEFISGEFDTGFIAANEETLLQPETANPGAYAAGLLWTIRERLALSDDDPWSTLKGFRLNAPRTHRLDINTDGSRLELTLESSRRGVFLLLGDKRYTISNIMVDDHKIRFDCDGSPNTATVATSANGLNVWIGADVFVLPTWQADYASEHTSGTLAAPMPGVVTALIAEAGAKVSKGETLLVMEAMKMEHAIEAPSDGVLIMHHFKAGDQVQQGALLVEFDFRES